MSNEQSTVVWVHGDCLNPEGPALQLHPDAPAIWVWDDALLDQWQISLKRIVFIYECLLELPVVIRRGDVAAEVVAFAEEHGAQTIATTESPGPRFRAICKDIGRSARVQTLPVEPLINYDGHLDLKRFSRYWRVAERYAFDPTKPQAVQERFGFGGNE
ncbi:MAG: hypothetical protein GFH27_549301n102 [Chloroflexi bacterium AL-W]|nr:hypothetical protein [Chloroflexi bacterium AL-N1]NOK68295.1 hypothetical protein [Chloroflexi bacterium AL-N10]NOK73941.1 hypothetical protein [Chloroflexi bacterium AL-N5]NOK82909.1 hypothetical protein [Chloroflexi bacterium AL-W]NOK90431.1 hypothetical protein [Chloroflexi bacterium AL-N15]